MTMCELCGREESLGKCIHCGKETCADCCADIPFDVLCRKCAERIARGELKPFYVDIVLGVAVVARNKREALERGLEKLEREIDCWQDAVEVSAADDLVEDIRNWLGRKETTQ